MTDPFTARRPAPERTSAVRRLAAAREDQRRLDALPAPDAPTHAAGRADVAAREQWLHWIDEGGSLEPWADGEWAPVDDAHERASESRDAAVGARVIRERIRQGEDDLRQAVADMARQRKELRST